MTSSILIIRLFSQRCSDCCVLLHVVTATILIFVIFILKHLMSLFAFFFAVAKVGRANPFKVRSESILMSALFDLE